MRNIILGFLAGFTVSACGGGGGPVEVSYNTLRVFSDGAGVAVGTTGATKELTLIPEVSAVVTEVNNLGDASQYTVELSSFPIIGSTANSTIRQGAITSDGITQNILIYEIDGEQGFGQITMPEYGIKYYSAQSNGDPVNPTGTFTYAGDQLVEAWQSGSFSEIGTVTITANFDSNSISYSGQTASSTLNGTGVLEVDEARFTDVDATLVVSGQTYTTTIHGLVNGTDASSTTGVFHTNDLTPDYAGAFVAKKQ